MFLLLVSLIRAEITEEEIALLMKQAQKIGCPQDSDPQHSGLNVIPPGNSTCFYGCYVFGTKSQLTADVSSNNGEAFKWNDQTKTYSNFNLIYDYLPVFKLTCKETSKNCTVLSYEFQCGMDIEGKITLPKELYVLYSTEPQTVEFDAQGDSSKGEYHRLDVSTSGELHIKASISGENIAVVGENIELDQITKEKEMDVTAGMGFTDNITFFASESNTKYNGHFKFQITAKSSTSDDDDDDYKEIMELFPKIVGKVPNTGVFYSKDGKPADASKSGDATPKPGGISGGGIAAIVIVVLLVIGIACACVWFFVFRKKSDEAAA